MPAVCNALISAGLTPKSLNDIATNQSRDSACLDDDYRLRLAEINNSLIIADKI